MGRGVSRMQLIGPLVWKRSISPIQWFDAEECPEDLGALSQVVWELVLF